MRSNAFIVLGIVLILGSLAGIFQVLNSDYGALLPVAITSKSDEGFEPFAVPLNTLGNSKAPSIAELLPSKPELDAIPVTGDEGLLNPEENSVEEEPAAPKVEGVAPDRIIIPSIDLDAEIISAEKKVVELDGVSYEEWLAPDKFASGWHTDSAKLGEGGNVVLNGHHNVYGKVFGKLIDLKVGDKIVVMGGSKSFTYTVTNMMIMPEKRMGFDVRLENARWIQPSTDSRLTLVTCWPATSNTHRLIIVAKETKDTLDLKGLQ